MDHSGPLDTEDELGPLGHLAPSPQSEAVAHEFQELSLQSSQHLPPLNERKNGESVRWRLVNLAQKPARPISASRAAVWHSQ